MVSIPSVCATLRFLRVVVVRPSARGQHSRAAAKEVRGRRCSHAGVVEEDGVRGHEPGTLAREEVYSRLRFPVTVNQEQKKRQTARRREENVRVRTAAQMPY